MGGGGGGGKGEASGDSVGSLPCTPMHASAGGCRPVQHGQGPKSCLTPFFFFGRLSSAQLSGARETNRCVRWRAGARISPSALALLSKRQSRYASRQPDAQVQKSLGTPQIQLGRGVQEGEGKGKANGAYLAPPRLLLARARTQHSKSPSAPTPAPSWPAAQPLLQHQKLMATHPTCRRSAEPKLSNDHRGCKPSRVDGKRNSLLLMLRRESRQPAYLACEAGPHQ
jgi:hypothetical protein